MPGAIRTSSFQSLSQRLAFAVLLVAALLAAITVVTPVAEWLETSLAAQAELRFERAVGKAPRLDDKLVIFSLDDSSFASLGRPALTGADWALILRRLAAARPRAIYTTHMFGAGEFGAAGGELEAALAELSVARVPVVAAGFAYPATIAFRDAIPLDRPAFAPRPGGEALRGDGMLGWRLYGPAPADVERFAAIGHTSYDGDGHLRTALRLSASSQVPHLSLALAAALPVEADAQGRVRLPIVPAADVAARAKSLRSLLRDESEGLPELPDEAVVLVLTEMYAGRVTFAPTPVGPTPAGYLAASALNASLAGRYPRALPLAPLAAAVLAALLGVTGLISGGIAFVTIFVATSVVVALSGLAAFAYAGLIVPWAPALICGAAASLGLSARRLARRLEADRERHQRNEREQAKLGAIVRTAQMFAHDVRKPFSMLKMAIEAVQRETDPAASRALFGRLFPELTRSMASVEGMIHDIMEIDSHSRLTPEDLPPEQLLASSLGEVLLIRREAEVTFDYELKHTLDVRVDAAKVRRALVNIIDNAMQAMHGRGRMWVRTRDALTGGTPMVELTIGNSGSYIPPEIQPRVFEAFFTAGKKGGTGLGLAIAHKAVTAHGGHIACASSREVGTEFTLSLPAAHVTPRVRDAEGLPLSSLQVASPFAGEPRIDTTEAALAAGTRLKLAALGRPLRVLLVDDEAFYREQLAATLAACVPEATLEVRLAGDADEALRLARSRAFDLAFCDVDLGPTSVSGFELVTMLRANGARGLIIVHSNRVLPADARASEAAGADAFLPKPATRAKLLTLLSEAAEAAKPEAASGEKPILAVVDDSPFTLEAWKLLVRDAEVLTFDGPRSFWAAAEADAGLLPRITFLVTDYYFDDEPQTDGVQFAGSVKAWRPELKIFLSSNAEPDDVPAGVLDGMIGKEPAGYAELLRIVKRSG